MSCARLFLCCLGCLLALTTGIAWRAKNEACRLDAARVRDLASLRSLDRKLGVLARKNPRDKVAPEDVQRFLWFDAPCKPDQVHGPDEQVRAGFKETTYTVCFGELTRVGMLEYLHAVRQVVPSLQVKEVQMHEIPWRSYRGMDQWKWTVVLAKREKNRKG